MNCTQKLDTKSNNYRAVFMEKYSLEFKKQIVPEYPNGQKETHWLGKNMSYLQILKIANR